jgi:hypothetical protein
VYCIYDICIKGNESAAIYTELWRSRGSDLGSERLCTRPVTSRRREKREVLSCRLSPSNTPPHDSTVRMNFRSV